MAHRKFLRATVATEDNSFVAVIEGRSGEWEAFIASPRSMWSRELETKVARLKAGGSWVIETQRSVWGEGYSESTEALEFYKLLLLQQDLQDAIAQIRVLLRALSEREIIVSLVWEGILFTQLGEMRYEVLIQGPFNPSDYRKRFRQTKLVRWWIRHESSRFFVRLIKSDKTLQDTCQVLVDALPEDSW